jgi:hypothetical protein
MADKFVPEIIDISKKYPDFKYWMVDDEDEDESGFTQEFDFVDSEYCNFDSEKGFCTFQVYFRRKSDGKFFTVSCQEGRNGETLDDELIEVRQRTVTITEFIPFEQEDWYECYDFDTETWEEDCTNDIDDDWDDVTID